MNPSQNAYNLIKGEEGCRLSAYLDQHGVPTIGWGTIVYQNGYNVKLGNTITQAQADSELAYQVALKTTGLNALLSVHLNQNQYDSLVDFCYNEGLGAFHGSTLRKLVNANPSDPNITDAFLMWVKINENGTYITSPDLVARRKKEAKLYFT